MKEKVRNTIVRKKLYQKLIASFMMFLLLVQFILPFSYVLSVNDALTISTKEELFAFARTVNSGNGFRNQTIRLTADINLNNENWIPIGTWEHPFGGTFEGDGHTITGLSISSTERHVGLFGRTYYATIKNLTIKNGKIEAKDIESVPMQCVGGIAGGLDFGNLENCHNLGVDITIDNSTHVGGLVGWAESITEISYCSNRASITGTVFQGTIGGIVGLTEGDVTKSFNHGNISVTGIALTDHSVGGIAGMMCLDGVPQSATVTYCYQTGEISGNGNLGGIVGSIHQSGSILNNCYNVGNVKVVEGSEQASQAILGGIVGRNGDTSSTFDPKGSSISNSYFLAGTSNLGVGENNGGIVSVSQKTASEMKTQTFVDTLNQGETVFLVDHENENSGYPILTKPYKSVQLADQKLYLALVEILGNKVIDKNDNQRSFTMSEQDLLGVTTLDLSSKGINKLGGIENFTELKKLNLYKNDINDVTPILSLTKLTELNVEGNRISNLPTFSELTQLTTLYVGFQRFQKTVVGLYEEQEVIQLPQTIRKALDPNSSYYAGNQIDFGNCELGEDGTSIVFDASVAANYGVMLKITGGKLKDTYYYVNGVTVNYVLDSTEEDLPNLDLDLNSDGTVNQEDAEMIRKWYQGQTLTEQEQAKISQMDLNRDGYINVLDYHRLSHYIAQKSNFLITYPIIPEGTTKESILAEVVTNSEELSIAQSHLFEQNGEHEFKFTVENVEFTLMAKIDCIQKEELTYQTRYSTTDPTNQDVTVTIVANHELIDQYYLVSEEGEEVFDSGWRLAEDHKTITKTFTENTEEDVPLSDIFGNNEITTVAITNITKETPPSATLTMKQGEEEYQTGKWTNSEVTVSLNPDSIQSGLTASYSINGEGNYTGETTLSEEGSYQIQVKTVDAAGNTATKEYTVLIDKTVPEAGNLILKANSSTGDRLENEAITNQNVYLSTEGGSDAFSGIDKITYSINGGEEHEDSQIIRLAGTYHIQVKTYDKAGNVTETTYSFTIDKTVPQLSITYERLSNELVKVQIVADKPMKEIDGWVLSQDKKTFTKSYDRNIQETIQLEDLVGNTVEAEISITGIQESNFFVNVNYTPEGKTNQNVTAIITGNQEMKELAGWTLSSDKREMRKTYQQNQEESLLVTSVTDKKAYIQININQIDREAPAVKVQYSTTQKTKEDVTVTLTAGEALQALSGWTLSENKYSLTKTFSANETKTYVVKDIAGNETSCLVNMSWIDKEAPTLSVDYSTTKPTYNPVTVTIHANEPVKSIDNWVSSADQLTLTRTYTQNTEESITVSDLVGNLKTVKIKIQNIQKEVEIPENTVYQVTSDGYIMGIDPNTTPQEFIQKLGVSVDLGQETKIKTGKQITVGNKTYTLVVKGDISQDGMVDTMDLSSLVLALGGYSSHTLAGARQKAADVNLDGEIDTRDLSKLCLMIAGY